MVWDRDGDVSNTAVHTNHFILPIQQLMKYYQVQRTSVTLVFTLSVRWEQVSHLQFFFLVVLGKGRSNSALSVSLVAAKHHMSFYQVSVFFFCICVLFTKTFFNHILHDKSMTHPVWYWLYMSTTVVTTNWHVVLSLTDSIKHPHTNYIPSQISCCHWWLKGVRQRRTLHADLTEKLKPQERHEVFFFNS